MSPGNCLRILCKDSALAAWVWPEVGRRHTRSWGDSGQTSTSPGFLCWFILIPSFHSLQSDASKLNSDLDHLFFLKIFEGSSSLSARVQMPSLFIGPWKIQPLFPVLSGDTQLFPLGPSLKPDWNLRRSWAKQLPSLKNEHVLFLLPGPPFTIQIHPRLFLLQP